MVVFHPAQQGITNGTNNMRYLLAFLVIAFALTFFPTAHAKGNTYYVSVRAARVRADATTDSKTLAIVKRDTAVAVIEAVPGDFVGDVNTWYHVRVNGIEGYMLETLLTEQAPMATITV